MVTIRRQSVASTPGSMRAAVRASGAGRGGRREAEIAARAARAVDRPETNEFSLRISRGFSIWILARVIALGLLWGASYVVYDLATSDRFLVRSVHVTGTRLVSSADVERVAELTGTNVFWINPATVESRVLKRLPSLRYADVTPILPGTVEIAAVERVPAAVWESGGQTYTVDREGVVLRQIGPSDPVEMTALLRVAQVEGESPSPGDSVDARVVANALRLAEVLPRAGVQPLGFEWSQSRGLEVPTAQGWRVRFPDSSDAEVPLSTLAAIREHLATTRQSAELIDLRFPYRPYYR